jgi:hypothetical protein
VYFNGDCNAAAKTGCLSFIPSDDSNTGSFGDGTRFLSLSTDKVFVLPDAEFILVDPCTADSKEFELFPLSCLSIEFVKLVGAGVFAAEDVGDDEDELVDPGLAWPWALDSFLSFSFLILGLNSVMTTVKSLTVTL